MLYYGLLLFLLHVTRDKLFVQLLGGMYPYFITEYIKLMNFGENPNSSAHKLGQ